MNSWEFYSSIDKYKANFKSLKHDGLVKYYAKEQLSDGSYRYYYSKEEYDAAHRLKQAQQGREKAIQNSQKTNEQKQQEQAYNENVKML